MAKILLKQQENTVSLAVDNESMELPAECQNAEDVNWSEVAKTVKQHLSEDGKNEIIFYGKAEAFAELQSKFSEENVSFYLMDEDELQEKARRKKKRTVVLSSIGGGIVLVTTGILLYAGLVLHVFCDHVWLDATCTEPQICEKCGNEQGEPLGNQWERATCIAPETCKVCGETQGEINPNVHFWINATCTEPKTCKWCGKTEGEPAEHQWAEATCTEPKTCTVCGATSGKALGHKWKGATCTEPKTCNVCGETEGKAKGHQWKEATCQKPKTCSVCGETTGQKEDHQWVDATYASPETCKVCGETNGDPLPLPAGESVEGDDGRVYYGRLVAQKEIDVDNDGKNEMVAHYKTSTTSIGVYDIYDVYKGNDIVYTTSSFLDTYKTEVGVYKDNATGRVAMCKIFTNANYTGYAAETYPFSKTLYVAIQYESEGEYQMNKETDSQILTPDLSLDQFDQVNIGDVSLLSGKFTKLF